MCYLFPIGACTMFTALCAFVSLAASGSASYSVLYYYVEPEAVKEMVNGNGVCLEKRVFFAAGTLECPDESMHRCGGTGTCCYGGYNCGYDVESDLRYCENDCSTNDDQCLQFVDGSVDFEEPDIPMRLCMYTTSIAAAYHLLVMIGSLCTNSTARFFTWRFLAFWAFLQAATLITWLVVNVQGFYCDMNPRCFTPGRPAQLVTEMCDAAGMYLAAGGGSFFLSLVAIVLYYKRNKFITALIEKRDTIPDEEAELIDSGGAAPGEGGWGLDAIAKDKEKEKGDKDADDKEGGGVGSGGGAESTPSKGKRSSKVAVTPAADDADRPGTAASAVSEEAKATPAK